MPRSSFARCNQYEFSLLPLHLLADLKKILCVLADEEANDKYKLAMKKHFATACRYELLFWDMAYGN